jgi:hypothetical protein
VDVIEVLNVGSERFVVRTHAELNGRYKTRYNFTRFGPDGKWRIIQAWNRKARSLRCTLFLLFVTARTL